MKNRHDRSVDVLLSNNSIFDIVFGNYGNCVLQKKRTIYIIFNDILPGPSCYQHSTASICDGVIV